MAIQNLVVILGQVSVDSLFAKEFYLSSIFPLKVGIKSYREILESLIKETERKLGQRISIEWNETDFQSQTQDFATSKKAVVFDALDFPVGTQAFQDALIRQLKLGPGILKLGKADVLDLRDEDNIYSLLILKSPHRHFNSLEIADGFVLKKCTFEDKGQKEFLFLSSIPSEVQEFFPRVQNYQAFPEWQQYQVELVKLFDFGRISLHGKIPLHVFERFLNKLEEYRSKSPQIPVGEKKYQQVLEDLFITKLEARFQELLAMPAGPELAKKYNLRPQFDELKDLLKTKISQIQETKFVVTHGDLCFSNILYGVRSGKMKFIDPRGVKSAPEIYGPWYYDLAKLTHSVFGQYDLIINDVNQNNDIKALFESLQNGFVNWLKSHNWDLQFLRLCEASLFFSMLPFHMSRPDHVASQIQSGMNALNSAKKLG